MTDEDLVAAVVDHHYQSLLRDDVARCPRPPAEMVAGLADADGWTPWKTVPSTVTRAQLRALERTLPAPLPAALKAYFQHRCVLMTGGLMLPEVRSDDPLGAFLEEVENWRPLLAAGYIPFAEYGDGYGPACCDVLQPYGADDYAVVWLDHEEVLALEHREESSRAELARLAKPLFPSFRDLLRDTLHFLREPEQGARSRTDPKRVR